MHYYKNKYQSWGQPELRWGLSSKRNKLKLPQSVCNLGLIGNDGDDRNSIVACLRDGNVFVIPVTPMDGKGHDLTKNNLKDLNIALYKLPKNSDNNTSSLSSIIDDNFKPYSQGFASGYVRVKDLDASIDQISEKGRMVLLIFHAWAGGLIDCHCCNLLPDRLSVDTNNQTKKIQDNDKQLKTTWSRILASRGVLEELVSFLLSLDLNNRLLNKNSTVFKAASECKSLGVTITEILDVVTSNSNKHHQLESLSKLVDDLVFGTESKDKLYI